MSWYPEAQRGPILDGMEYWYLSEQLQKFHAGIRGQNQRTVRNI